ncbi:odorant receptor 82a [Episyrphus balteatus]|uniref:odorant receptor 82a n=1 Tax=Episyrphus balteatus TaxID=286459 RepID=UPI00248600E7|nr:odorant receptor 82a [Episyrphus balteatus]
MEIKIGTQIFYRQTKCLNRMGHSLDQQIKESKLKQISQIFLLFVVASAQYPLINYLIYHRNNMELVTACMSVACTNILSFVKFITYFINKEMFLEITNEFKTMWENSDEFASNFIKVQNKMADRAVNLYFYSIISTASYFMVTPVAKVAYGKMFNVPIVRELPMAMRFFFDAEQSPGYECAFIYTGLVTFIVVQYVVATDGFFIAFTIHLRSHFKLLQQNIENNTFLKNDATINYEICSYVKYHIKLLDLANKICETFKPIIFIHFLITSLQVCVIIYQLVTNLDNAVILAIYITFLTSILLQLLIYCFGGEMLKTESLMVGTSIQISRYYNLSPKYRKMLCLILMRSQKEVIVKAGFYVASLENFMTILKAAMSYITLIQSIEQV